jgi:hypothetical protein
LAVWQSLLQNDPGNDPFGNRHPVTNGYVSAPRHLPLVYVLAVRRPVFPTRAAKLSAITAAALRQI